MTDDISAAKHYRQAIATVCEGFTLPDAARKVLETALWNPPTESATTPAEVELPTIDRDEAFQRDYIPLGRSGWEIQTKGKGSTYRICDKDGDRLAIPDVPYLHETLTRMAREVHADYATLARQLELTSRLLASHKEDHANVLRAHLRAESALVAATQRVAEVRGMFESCVSKIVPTDYANGYREALDHIDAALKEPK